MTARGIPLLLSMSLLMIAIHACRHPGNVATTGDRAISGLSAKLADVEWRLTHLGDTPVVTPDMARQPFIRFSSENSRVEGFASCNQFSGPYVLEESRVRLSGPAMATQMACVEPELNAQEQRFLTGLETVDRYRIDEDTLTLFAGDRAFARFRRSIR